MERYKDGGSTKRGEPHTGSKQPIPVVNGNQSENSSRSSKRNESFCNRCVAFLRYDHEYSLYCLSENNPVRRLSKYIVVSRGFEYFILLNIVANCVVLALNKPLPESDKIEMSEALENAETYFLVIFCIEASLKITALGFVMHPGSYLRNVWNVLDFIVVVVGLISLKYFSLDTTLDVKSLRAVRVLRPLKLISGIPSLQVVMKSIGRAMVPLLQIALLVLFVIVIYAIIGLEFLMDKFHDTCFNSTTNKSEEKPSPCDKRPYHGIRKRIHGRECGPGMTCRGYWEGPDYGITTFDNIALSMISVFQCITMEGWTDVMYKTFDAIDKQGYLYSIYFVSLIVIGSFFMLNLVLGVLSGEFAKERERVETRRAFFKVRRQQKLEREVAGYIEWITKAEEALTKEHARKDGSRSISDTTESQAHVICNDLVINPSAVLTKQNGNGYRLNVPEEKSFLDTLAILEVRFRFFIRKAVKSQWFYWAVLVCVFLNTVSLATEHYDQPTWLNNFQEWTEAVFLVVFTFEMVLKMYSLGIRIYFSSSFNIFDCVVVCSGIIEALLNALLPFDLNLGISVLRCIRLLRVFKVTRHWTSLRNLATSLVSSIKSIMSLIFLLFLFILIAALLGMQIFGGKFRFKMKTPRTNFDNFPNAMLTVFQILTGEDWNTVMNDGIRAYDGAHSVKGVAVSLYFVLLVIVGNYTLLNVFLAIAVDNLANAQILTEDEENEKKEREKKKSETREKFSLKPASNKDKRHSHWGKTKSIPVLMALKKLGRNKENDGDLSESEYGIRGMSNSDTRWSENLGKKIENFRREDSLYTNKSNGQIKERDGNASDDSQRPEKRKRRVRERERRRGRGRSGVSDDEEGGKKEEDGNDEDDEERVTAKNFVNVLKTGRLGNRRRRGRKEVPIIRTKSMFIFGPDNGFRKLCHRIVNLAHFDTAMLVVIVFSSLVIAVEDPVNDDNERNKILWYFDCVFTSIFAFEVIVKVIDMGLILHKGAYLRSIWNIIDGVVVVCNIASLILPKVRNPDRMGKTAIRALRVMRVLRPFKSVHKIKKLQAVFRCMWFSVKNVANILMITMLFLFIFAVMGVQLFNGKFFYCTDESKLYKFECKGQYFKYDYEAGPEMDPRVEQREWKRRKLNFDTVYEAMLTLYTSSTGEGWPTAMHRTMDTTEKDKGPVQDFSTVYAIYYVSFVVVFSFFFLNIFVALIILTFQDLGEKEISNCELDRNQRDCIHFSLTAKPGQMYMPRDHKTFQYRVWMLVTSKPFDIIIMVLISLNTIVLMMQYHKQPNEYKEVCSWLNIAFTALFILEAVLKLIALRLNYFRDYWNIFDFVIVLGGILDITVTKAVDQIVKNRDYIPIDPSMFRLFRAARLIKLLRQGYTIRILLWTFFRSFKALPYVTLLIMLMFFMYAVIGMQLFGKVAYDEEGLNSYNNFRDILQALQVLFRSATGENWHLIMIACFSDAKCDPGIVDYDENETCGSTFLAVLYFCSFIFLCMFLMLNLFVAVIMDNFEYLTRDESILGPHHLDEFARVWSEYDPCASGCIHHSEVYKMMCSMSPPVGFGKKCPRIVGYKRLIKMNMPVSENGDVTFQTTLFALIRTSLNIKLQGNMNANDTELRKIMKRLWPNSTSNKILDKLIPKQSVLSSQQMTIGKIYCAKLIHENYKYSRRREEQGERPKSKGFLEVVGSLRDHGYTTDQLSPDFSHNRNYLRAAPRPRSRTLDSKFSSEPESRTSHTPSQNEGSHLNSVTRSRSWSSKANGDIEMMELKHAPTKPLSRNGRARTAVEEPKQAPLTLAYLAASTKPRNRSARNNSYSIAVDLEQRERDENDIERRTMNIQSEDADSKRSSRGSNYYDDMISRINEHITSAVKSGQSPYAIYGMEDDDENEWC